MYINRFYTIRFSPIKVILVLWVFLVAFCPSFLMDPTTVYRSTSPIYIGYDLLGYQFSFLEIPIIIVGMWLYRKSTCIRFLPIFLLVLATNIIRYLFDITNPFTLSGYEMFLSNLSALACCSILCYYYRNKLEIERVIDLIIIFNCIGQLLFLLTGRTQESRVSVWGQDVGSIGLFAAMYMIYFIMLRERRDQSFITLMASIVSLILSGSRTNIVIMCFALLFVLPLYINKIDKQKKFMFTFLGVICTFTFLYTYNNLNVLLNINDFDFITRSFDLLTGNGVSNDQSFNERLISFDIGLSIIENNPLGIANSFIDLQYRTQQLGFYAFPHSTFITYYLLWGIGGIISYLVIIERAIKAFKIGINSYGLFLLFLLILFLFYGGPIISVKVQLWYFLFFTYLFRGIDGTYDVTAEKDKWKKKQSNQIIK